MKAVVYEGPNNVSVENAPDPKIEQIDPSAVKVFVAVTSTSSPSFESAARR